MRFKAFIRQYFYTVLGALMGLLIAILFMTIGFWRSMLVLLLMGGFGYLGHWLDGGPRFQRFVESILHDNKRDDE